MPEPLAVRIHRSAPDDWDHWLLDAPSAPGFAQTTTWAAMAAAGRSADVWFVEVLRSGQRIAGALLTRDRGLGPLTRVPGLPGTILGRDGPAVDPDDDDALMALLGAIDTVRRTAGAPAVVLQPSPRRALAAALAPHLARPWRPDVRATAIVDLDRPLTEVWSGLAKSTRKNVRRCREERVTVREIADRATYVAHFLTALDRRANAPRQWRTVRNEVMWDLGAGISHRFFVAERDRTILATLGTQRWNGTVTEIASSRTPESVALGLPAQDLLHWEILAAHHRAGDTAFDLAGFTPDSSDPKEKGIRRFKTKWGGEVVPVTRFERPTEAPLARLALRLLRRSDR